MEEKSSLWLKALLIYGKIYQSNGFQENATFSPNFGKIRRKLVKFTEIGGIRRKLPKVAENSDHSSDPCFEEMPFFEISFAERSPGVVHLLLFLENKWARQQGCQMVHIFSDQKSQVLVYF
jgi:hypothetical protein